MCLCTYKRVCLYIRERERVCLNVREREGVHVSLYVREGECMWRMWEEVCVIQDVLQKRECVFVCKKLREAQQNFSGRKVELTQSILSSLKTSKRLRLQYHVKIINNKKLRAISILSNVFLCFHFIIYSFSPFPFACKTWSILQSILTYYYF